MESAEREQELMDAVQQAQRRSVAHSGVMNELSITEATVEESEDKHTTIKWILQKQLEEQHEKGTVTNELSEEVNGHQQEFLEREIKKPAHWMRRGLRTAAAGAPWVEGGQSSAVCWEMELEELKQDQEEEEDVKEVAHQTGKKENRLERVWRREIWS